MVNTKYWYRVVVLIISLLLLAIGGVITTINFTLLESPNSQPVAENMVVNDTPFSQLLPPIKEIPSLIDDYLIHTKAIPNTLSAVTVTNVPTSSRANNVIKQNTARLEKQLKMAGFQQGSPILIRIFKVPAILELWIKKNGRFELFRTYSICRFSGKLGPKTKVGDRQAPEGFYSVSAKQLNPNSNYFLSFNLGYPNEYDRYHKRTGSALMVHGECASVGCYAMSNARMAEIYTLMHEAFLNGQAAIQVQVYPFALTDSNMRKMQRHNWYNFWVNLKQGYDKFEKSHATLNVTVNNGKYQFLDNQ